MPIKNFVTGDVPFLVKYDPYQLDTRLQVVDEIANMVSYDIKPMLQPSTIDYYTGTETPYKSTFQIKNLTDNVLIQVTIMFDNKTFRIYEQDAFMDGQNELTFNITPEQVKTFVIETKNISLDARLPYSQYNSNIELRFKNVSNGTFVTKRISTVGLADKQFPTAITVR